VARIKLGVQKELVLGNLDAKRDWGFAGDYVRACWMMLQQDEPDDYVIATGEMHSVRDLLDLAFGYVDLDWHDFVRVDTKLFRPADINTLRGDAGKAKQILGWEPTVNFTQLVRMMVDADMKRMELEMAH
jgi:GDPmannose 4,6-dehydratase